ncbi:MAG: hypothetical protein WAL52_19470 [Candidatus Sulfotelmatobacter sp.]
MDDLGTYRKIPTYPAGFLAGLLSSALAVGSAAAGVFVLDFILQRVEGGIGLGGGVLIVCAVPNIAIPFFVFAFSALINLHHPTSWPTPTLAFALCAILTWVWIPFSVGFAPVVLGTGAIAWFVSCLLLRKNEGKKSEHVIQT